ncbi:MAG: hypothetical protein QM770_21500 [Tepidisphaeraceae bacterium]
MTIQLKGRVTAGKIELIEPLTLPEGTEVQVIAEVDQTNDRPMKPIYFGMFKKDGARMSTEEDFIEAKKMWEPRDL